jgi:CelD/BcsL family acetyltransferase involved in cellulose biosynthesis
MERCGRVLHLINGDDYSGAERVQDLLALRLREFGFEVGIACTKPGRFREARQAQDVPLIELPMAAALQNGSPHSNGLLSSINWSKRITTAAAERRRPPAIRPKSKTRRRRRPMPSMLCRLRKEKHEMVAETDAVSAMTVSCIEDDAAFDVLAESWNRLTAETGNVPFRSWDWLRFSWRHFQSPDSSLFILAVRDADGTLIGLAPWYRRRSAWQGDVVRFLGSDQASSDYLSVLSAPQREHDVARKLAGWLGNDGAGQWDLIELDGIDADDKMSGLLVDELKDHGHTVHLRAGLNCWRLQLPDDWDDYLARLSRNRRQKLRSMWRKAFGSGTAVPRRADSEASLQQGLEILVDLHERRRTSVGEIGCFSHEQFTAFLFDVARRMHACGQLRLQWIEVDGTPVAVDFSVSGSQCVYGYQCGINPDYSKLRPRTLMMAANFQQAIHDGYREFDFLRGDEDYKTHWAAQLAYSRRSSGGGGAHQAWLVAHRSNNQAVDESKPSPRPSLANCRHVNRTHRRVSPHSAERRTNRARIAQSAAAQTHLKNCGHFCSLIS